MRFNQHRFDLCWILRAISISYRVNINICRKIVRWWRSHLVGRMEFMVLKCCVSLVRADTEITIVINIDVCSKCEITYPNIVIDWVLYNSGHLYSKQAEMLRKWNGLTAAQKSQAGNKIDWRKAASYFNPSQYVTIGVAVIWYLLTFYLHAMRLNQFAIRISSNDKTTIANQNDSDSIGAMDARA